MTPRRKFLVAMSLSVLLVAAFFVAPFPIATYIAQDPPGEHRMLADNFDRIYPRWIVRQTNPYGRLFVAHLNQLCAEHRERPPDFCSNVQPGER